MSGIASGEFDRRICQRRLTSRKSESGIHIMDPKSKPPKRHTTMEVDMSWLEVVPEGRARKAKGPPPIPAQPPARIEITEPLEGLSEQGRNPKPLKRHTTMDVDISWLEIVPEGRARKGKGPPPIPAAPASRMAPETPTEARSRISDPPPKAQPETASTSAALTRPRVMKKSPAIPREDRVSEAPPPPAVAKQSSTIGRRSKPPEATAQQTEKQGAPRARPTQETRPKRG